MKNIFTTLLLTTLCTVYGQQSHANTEQIIQMDSGTPYKVVIESANGSSSEMPGLYVRDGRGWKLLQSGEVLINPQRGPMIQPLAISRLDQSITALTAVNGELLLFSAKSKAEDPTSFVRFDKNQPILEAGTSQERYLPAIADNADLTLYLPELDTRAGVQLVLASVRLPPNPLVKGNGVTLLLAVKANPKSDQMVLEFPPTIIDYNFHESPLALSQLMMFDSSTAQHHIDSELVRQYITKQIRRTHFDEHQKFTNIKTHELIAKMQASEPRARLAACGLKSSDCSVNFASKHAETDLLFNTPAHANLHIRQDYDLLTGQTSFSVVQGQDVISTQVGLLDLSEIGNTKFKVDTVHTDETAKIVRAFSAGGELQLVFAPETEARPRVIRTGQNPIAEPLLPGEVVDDIQLVVKSIKSKTEVNKFTHYLFISKRYVKKDATDDERRDSKRGTTEVIKIQHYNGASAAMTNRVTLLNQYLNHDLLTVRIKADSEKNIVFDGVTPATDSVESYTTLYNDVIPHIDIENSAPADIKYTFIRALEEIDLDHRLQYKKYEPARGVQNPTGISFKGADDKVVNYVGELIVPPSENGVAAERYISRTKAVSEGKETKHHVHYFKVFALDTNFDKAARGFNLLVYANALDGKNKSKIINIPVNIPFERISGIQIITGRKRGLDRFFLLMTIRSSDKDELGGALYFTGKFDFLNNKFEMERTQGQRLDKDIYEMSDLIRRIQLSKNGDVYFVQTPQLSMQDRKYTVLKLESNMSQSPNMNKSDSIEFEQAGILEGDDFSSWESKSSWRKNIMDMEKEFPEAKVIARDAVFREIFRQLGETISQVANPSNDPRHIVYLIPPELKRYAMPYIASLYLQQTGDKAALATAFSRFNNDLTLFVLDPTRATQENVIDNLDMIQKRPYRRPMIVAQIKDIRSIKRPSIGEGDVVKPFHLSVPTSTDEKLEGQDDAVETVTSHTQVEPHVLYLLEAGDTTSLEEFRTKKVSNRAAMVFVGTKEEWQATMAEADVEAAYGLEDRYQIVEMPLPDAKTRLNLLERVFERDTLRIQSFSFDYKGIKNFTDVIPSALVSKETVLEYAISRVETLARETRGGDSFGSFSRFVNAFHHALIGDREVTRTGVIDKRFIERVLTQVFDIPLNLEILPDHHPLKLLSHKDAVFKLQEAGYEGPFDIKRRVIEILLSKTRVDKARPLPSSLMLFGESGTGKTHLFDTIVTMLDLKLYEVKDPAGSKDANAFILRASRIVKEAKNLDDSGQDFMTWPDAQKHLFRLLSSPAGREAFILIDDLNAAPEDVQKEIVQFIRSLQDAPGGMYTVQNPDNGSLVTFPVRNLSLFMTFNPTDNPTKIQEFQKDKWTKPTTEEVVLATLSKAGGDKSFLRRWGAVFNLSNFPIGAKGPELIRKTIREAKEKLTNNNSFVLVSPRVIRELARKFPEMDARTFLSVASSTLLDRPSIGSSKSSGAYIIVPGQTATASGLRTGGNSFEVSGGKEGEAAAESDIRNYILRHTKAVAVTDRATYEGPLTMLQIMFDAFRIPVYEGLVNAVQEDRKYNDDAQQRYLLSPTLIALSHQISEFSTVPLRDLSIDPQDFGIRNTGDRDSFRNVIKEISLKDRSPFVVKFQTGVNDYDSFSDLLGNSQGPRSQSRRDILATAVQDLKVILMRHLEIVMETDNLDSLKNGEAWLRHLQDKDNKVAFKKTFNEMVKVLFRVQNELSSQHLAEVQAPNENTIRKMDPYVGARLFLVALDKAMSQLPWARLVHHQLDVIHRVSEDQVLAQTLGVQRYLFDSKTSMLRPTTNDLVNQMVDNAWSVSLESDEYKKKVQQNFTENCERYLTSAEGGRP